MTRVGATETEARLFLAEAQAWKSEISPVDAQAHNIVTAIRAKYPGGRLAPGQQPPAVPQKLVDLQHERDAITVSHVSHLKSSLGSQRFVAIDAKLHRVSHSSIRGTKPFQPSSPTLAEAK